MIVSSDKQNCNSSPPHLNLPIKGEEYKGTMSIPRQWWEGLGEEVNCYVKPNSILIISYAHAMKLKQPC